MTRSFDPESLVDFLKEEGLPSDMEYRKKLAAEYGIKDYSGTADQNTELLHALREKYTSVGSPTEGFWNWLLRMLQWRGLG